MKRERALALLTAALVAAACQRTAPPVAVGNGVCSAPETEAALPAVLRETSGVAASRAAPGIFWTHNDSGGRPVVYAISASGVLVGRVRVRGARNRDWEDVAVAPCGAERPGGGEPASCLFIADTGDNQEAHDVSVIYRVPEPDPRSDSVSRRATAIRFRYPDGPRDAEAMFVADGAIYVIVKGRSSAVDLYRLAPPFRRGIAVAERVQRLAPPPTSVSAQVTAAALDPSTGRVVVRTYGSLRFFTFSGDTLTQLGREADVVAPDQLQGEGVAFVDPDRLLLTSESRGPIPALLDVVACDPLRPPADSVGRAELPSAEAQSRKRTSSGT